MPRNTRSRHRSGCDAGPLQAATPRDVNISLYWSEKSTPGSYVQISRPVAGSRANTRLKPVDAINRSPTRMGVARNLEGLPSKASPSVASPVR